MDQLKALHEEAVNSWKVREQELEDINSQLEEQRIGIPIVFTGILLSTVAKTAVTWIHCNIEGTGIPDTTICGISIPVNGFNLI